MYRVFVPQVEGVWAPAVHSNCLHNEWASLSLRTMGQTPSDPHDMASLVGKIFNGHKTLLRRKLVQRWSLDQVVSSYKGRLARRYTKAKIEMEVTGLEPDDWRLSPFLKGEKFNPLIKTSKPRMINPRGPKYNLVLASFLKPVEHLLWKHWKHGHLCQKTRVSGKALNGRQRANLIQKKWQSVGDCVAVEVDGKAFEAHVTREQLLLEHSVYKAAYSDPLLARLLEKQLVLRGKTAGGIKFSRPGSRASGDFNTGLGNTMLMGSFVIAAMTSMDLEVPWSVLADGDNCLLFLHRSSYEDVIRRFPQALSSFCGHEMTIEKPAFTLEKVTFGQCQPVLTSAGYTMVRNPFKVLSGAFSGYRYFNEPVMAEKLLKAIAQAELSLNRGVPLLQTYFSRALSLLDRVKNLRAPADFLEGHLVHANSTTDLLPVTAEVRASFERAFDLDAESQIALEKRLLICLQELPVVLRERRWLRRVVQPVHGPPGSQHEDSNDYLWLDGL